MGEPYVGEIRMFAGDYAPAGWALCNGASLGPDQNKELFALLGTTYGGDGQTGFKLPDLQGRVPLHMGQGPGLQSYVVGETGGVETVTLTVPALAGHTHVVAASTQNGQLSQPTNAFLAQTNPGFAYVAASTPVRSLNGQSVYPAGGDQPHENMAPFLALTFIISLAGIFPSPT